jgi:hypothetical protein
VAAQAEETAAIDATLRRHAPMPAPRPAHSTHTPFLFLWQAEFMI